MVSIRIWLDGDGAFRDWADREIVHLANGTELHVVALEAGMASGRPSVALGFELPDGRVVIAETSLRLFLRAADALSARYGDQRD